MESKNPEGPKSMDEKNADGEPGPGVFGYNKKIR
jgi:hypothetical protein